MIQLENHPKFALCKSPDFLAAGCEREMKLSNAFFKHPNGENAKGPKNNCQIYR